MVNLIKFFLSCMVLETSWAMHEISIDMSIQDRAHRARNSIRDTFESSFLGEKSTSTRELFTQRGIFNALAQFDNMLRNVIGAQFIGTVWLGSQK